MALGALGCCSSTLRCSSRSARPRPLSFLGISCWGCPSFFFQPSDGGAGGGSGGDGSAGSDDGEDTEAHPVPTKGAKSEVGAERIHCNDNKNDDIEQIKLGLTTIQHYLASIDKHLKTIVDFHVLIDNRLTTMMRISGFASPLATRQGPSTAAVVTGTPANEEAVKRMKILEELKGGCVPENVVLPENPESEAASAKGLHRDNSYTVQIPGPSIIPAYAVSK